MIDEMIILTRIQKRFESWLEQIKQADHYLEVRELLNVIPAHYHVQQAIKIIQEEIATSNRRTLVLDLDSEESYGTLEDYIKMCLDGRDVQNFAEEDACDGIQEAVLSQYQLQFRPSGAEIE